MNRHALDALVSEWRAAMEGVTRGPWGWVVHDHSMASLGVLPDPGLGDPLVLCVSPCGACEKRAHPQEWKWGRCHTPSEADASWLARCSPDKITALLDALTAQAARLEEMRSGAIGDVAAERRRQVEVEGWTPEHDDTHEDGELAGAAACYALSGVAHWAAPEAVKRFWPWDISWWKPKDHRRALVKAGALIIAEIERLDRASNKAGGDRG